jgi:copper chaperone
MPHGKKNTIALNNNNQYEDEMTSVTYKVPSIHCGHCVHTIEMELGDLKGVTAVKVDLETKTVRVDYQAPATLEQIKDTLKEINYPPEE